MTTTQLSDLLHYETKEINKKIRNMFGEQTAREKFSPVLRSNGQVLDYLVPELESKMFVTKHAINYLEEITQYWIDRNKNPVIPTTLTDALCLAADKAEEVEGLKAQ